MQKFELKRVTQIAPGCGEDLGLALAEAAAAIVSRETRAQVLYLAAEAYEAGAAASIGHNRAGRYEEAARRCRDTAAGLEAEVKAERDASEGVALLAAFDDGYARRDYSRRSFDRRAAAQLGEYFANSELPMPSAVAHGGPGNGTNGYLFAVDGTTYRVSYPEGKTNLPCVELAEAVAA